MPSFRSVRPEFRSAMQHACELVEKAAKSADELVIAKKLQELVEGSTSDEVAGRFGSAASLITETLMRDRLATVCHDLKDPLASIVMGAGLLRRTLPESEEASAKTPRRAVEAIARSAHRMSKLIQDFYDLAKLQAGELRVEARPIDACSLAVAVVEALRPAAVAKGVELEGATEGPWRVVADRARLVHVLTELVGNGIHFTPAGGKVALRAEPTDTTIKFSVTDTGIGIDHLHLPHVFDEEANSRHAPRGGPGRGLPLAKGLVELQGGSLDVTSVQGKGTTATVTLPRAEAPSVAP